MREEGFNYTDVYLHFDYPNKLDSWNKFKFSQHLLVIKINISDNICL